MPSIILSIVLCLIITPAWSSAETTRRLEIGLRGGGSEGGYNLKEDYVAAELYVLKQLPWRASLSGSTMLSTRFDAGLTYLEASDEEGCMLAAGADIVLELWEDSVEIEAGFRPTWMPKNEYGKDDFGGWLQFTSHAGVAIKWHEAVINYRYQHTSNASIFDPNPGLNLHMFGLGYRF